MKKNPAWKLAPAILVTNPPFNQGRLSEKTRKRIEAGIKKFFGKKPL